MDKAVDCTTSTGLKNLTVLQLKAFLRSRGKSVVGLKQQLISRAELFFDEPVLTQDSNEDSEPTVNAGLVPFEHPDLKWMSLEDLGRNEIPDSFDISTITQYLCEDVVDFRGQQDGIETDVGTKKPAVKGRQMYLSEKLFHVDFAKHDRVIFFRGKCEASLKKS